MRKRRTTVSRLLAASAALLMLLPATASATGYHSTWVYNDTDAGGRRAHGGFSSDFQHYKVVVTTRLKTCNPSNCAGTQVTVRSTKATCSPPAWKLGEYTCDALTSIYSGNPTYRCWGQVTVTVYHPNSTTIHYGPYSWEPEWGWGSCV